MKRKKRDRRTGARRALWIAAGLLAVLAAAVALYAAAYYRADEKAISALVPDGSVAVTQTAEGFFFDGLGEDAALIFYPGAKVEAAAYAPLMRRIADGGVDVFLLKMPLRMAVLDMDRAETVRARHDYARWYVGGHSLGGAVAAICASKHPGVYAAVVLCAAYPTGPLDADSLELSLYGSADGVLNRARLEEGRQYAPDRSEELVIEGGNHAQFGSYGRQRGDGEAAITPEEQWAQAASFILDGLEKAA